VLTAPHERRPDPRCLPLARHWGTRGSWGSCRTILREMAVPSAGDRRVIELRHPFEPAASAYRW